MRMRRRFSWLYTHTSGVDFWYAIESYSWEFFIQLLRTLCGVCDSTIRGTWSIITPLGGTFTRWQNTQVGSAVSIRQNCVFSFVGGKCEGSAQTVDDVADASDGGHVCKGTLHAFVWFHACIRIIAYWNWWIDSTESFLSRRRGKIIDLVWPQQGKVGELYRIIWFISPPFTISPPGL
jgi:hypothetical protein